MSDQTTFSGAEDEGLNRLDTSVGRLSDEVGSLKAELGAAKKALNLQANEQRKNTTAIAKRTRMLTGALAVGVVLVVLLIFTSWRSTTAQQETIRQQQSAVQRAIAQNNARWCPVVLPLAPQPGDPPPVGNQDQVNRSLRIRTAFDDLVRDFGCR